MSIQACMNGFLVIASIGALVLMVSALACLQLSPRMARALLGKRDTVNLSARLLASGLILSGIALATHNGYELWLSRDRTSWARVPAHVTHSALVEVMQPRSTSPGWRPDVTYTYEYNGRIHQGDRVTFGRISSSDREATWQWLQDTYPAGSRPLAWVNPDKPEVSALTIEVSGTAWIFVALGLALAGIGGYFLRLSMHDAAEPVKQRKRAKNHVHQAALPAKKRSRE